MSRLFISHASADNAAAAALHAWLREQGFDDVFLDIDAERGLVPGERWQEALKAATNRCETPGARPPGKIDQSATALFIRPATTRTLRGAASQIAVAEMRLRTIDTQNAGA